MSELTLQEGLGANATQNATDIILKKADLGLTGATNTLDQILVAIMLKAEQTATEANFNNEVEQNTYVQKGFLPSSTTKNNNTYIVKQLILNFAKLDDSTPNPMEY